MVYQNGKARDARPRKFRRVAAVQQVIHVSHRHISRNHEVKKDSTQCGGDAPALLPSQGSAQGLARDPERSPFISEKIAPAASTRGTALRIAPEGDGTGSGNHHQSGFAGGGAS